MKSDKHELLGLLYFLMLAKSEATRLELSEVERMIDLPALSLFLTYSGLEVEDLTDISDAAVSELIVETLEREDKAVLN